MTTEPQESPSPIGEFVSVMVTRNATEFTIAIKGPKRFENLVLHMINGIRITQHDVEEWCEE